MTIKTSLRVLFVDDSENDVVLLLRHLEQGPYHVTHKRVDTAEEMRIAIKEEWDVVICDYSMPRFSAVEALSLLRQEERDLPFLIVSGAIGEETAVEAMRAGAHDYLMKDKLLRLIPAIERELCDVQIRQEKRSVEKELLRSYKELEKFAFVSCHDLQEPLRKIGMYAQMLETDYKGKLDAQADTYIKILTTSVQRMRDLIEDVITYSLLRRGELKADRVDLETVLKKVLSGLEKPIRENGAVITHDPLPEILADHSQMAQMMKNLLDNAIKFRGDDPPMIHLSAQKNDREWIVSVADNGIGIDPKHAEKIFEIFQRLHTQDQYSGTGIGLAVCKKIAVRHGGRIWTKPGKDQGSVFYFSLPLDGSNAIR